MGVAATLGACAICERPRPPPPIPRIAFYPDRSTSYQEEEMAPARGERAVQHAYSSAVETTVGEVKTLSGTTRDPMTMCLKAWQDTTHISRAKWREICVRTLAKPNT